MSQLERDRTNELMFASRSSIAKLDQRGYRQTSFLPTNRQWLVINESLLVNRKWNTTYLPFWYVIVHMYLCAHVPLLPCWCSTTDPDTSQEQGTGPGLWGEQLPSQEVMEGGHQPTERLLPNRRVERLKGEVEPLWGRWSEEALEEEEEITFCLSCSHQLLYLDVQKSKNQWSVQTRTFICDMFKISFRRSSFILFSSVLFWWGCSSVLKKALCEDGLSDLLSAAAAVISCLCFLYITHRACGRKRDAALLFCLFGLKYHKTSRHQMKSRCSATADTADVICIL